MRHFILSLLLLLNTTFFLQAESTGWRGDGTGRYPDATPVSEWSKTKNILWTCKMPSWSNSSPILVGNKIFIHSEPSSLICIDSNTGKIIWQKDHPYADFKKASPTKEESKSVKKKRKKSGGMPKKHRDTGYTSHTPVSDGKFVYAVFGTGIAVCYDLEGKQIWAKLIEEPNENFGHSSSPVITGDKIVFHIVDLVALKMSDGSEVWRAKSKAAFGTSVYVPAGNSGVLFTPSGSMVNSNTGEILGKSGASLKYASPVIQGDKIYFIEKKARALRIPKNPLGKNKPELLWDKKVTGSRHYASSLIHEGLIYAVSRDEVLSVIDQKKGDLLYEKKLKMGGKKNSVYPSVALGGKFIYISSEVGTVIVMAPGKVYKEVARNTLEKMRCNPVFEKGKMYLRGMETLYCIGKKTTPKK